MPDQPVEVAVPTLQVENQMEEAPRLQPSVRLDNSLGKEILDLSGRLSPHLDSRNEKQVRPRVAGSDGSRKGVNCEGTVLVNR